MADGDPGGGKPGIGEPGGSLYRPMHADAIHDFERCLRCGAPLRHEHAHYRCDRCGAFLACCEGETCGDAGGDPQDGDGS
jgi:hypothetical protein